MSTVVVGATLGGLLTFLIEDQPAGALVLAAAALGGVLARALRDAMGPRL